MSRPYSIPAEFNRRALGWGFRIQEALRSLIQFYDATGKPAEAPNGNGMFFELITGRAANGQAAVFQIIGAAKNINGVTTLIGATGTHSRARMMRRGLAILFPGRTESCSSRSKARLLRPFVGWQMSGR